MERRIYFIVGDCLSSTVLAAIGTLAAYQLPTSWPMPIEMGVGMVVGMMATMVVMPLFLFLFGAMEIMVPAMLGSMMSSMVPSMMPLMRGDLPMLLELGAGCGFTAWLFTYLVDGVLHGERRHG
ncbi:MAG: hypothetical protein HQL94_05000 [Magnetococcales bacterium]|nr:hypothetical protein [Magnetococcales bacterium]MBF0438746.1 hypothetical protein [Magnetococcales bacterium]